jgi:hypothetical protein
MSNNWRDTCNFMADMLDAVDDPDRVMEVSQRMNDKTKPEILDGFTALSLQLVYNLAEERGAVDLAERMRMSKELLRRWALNPPPGY